MAEGLRQALMRLTGSQETDLPGEIEALRRDVRSLERLGEALGELETQFTQKNSQHTQRADELGETLMRLQALLNALEKEISGRVETVEREISARSAQLGAEIGAVQEELGDPGRVAERIGPVLTPVIHDRVREDEFEFAEAVAPVIGPAIRHQIRDARQDIIDALYPVIGQIISKAISETMRELNLKIDSTLKRQFDLRSRLSLLAGRFRGVSAAEQIVRGSLPYQIHHIFLIHRETGLLLDHSAGNDAPSREPDLISGMVTAIRDFVRESFGRGEGDLEEIAHGDYRILLESGQRAYVAIVLEGIEPQGYSQLVRDTVSEINLRHERVLREFDGEWQSSEELANRLHSLLSPSTDQLAQLVAKSRVSPGEKRALLAAVLGGLILLAGLIFACVYTVRLWPLVFPGQ